MKLLNFKDKKKKILRASRQEKDHIANKGKRIKVASNFFPETYKQEQRERHFQEMKGKEVIAKDLTPRQTVFHVSEL